MSIQTIDRLVRTQNEFWRTLWLFAVVPFILFAVWHLFRMSIGSFSMDRSLLGRYYDAAYGLAYFLPVPILVHDMHTPVAERVEQAKRCPISNGTDVTDVEIRYFVTKSQLDYAIIVAFSIWPMIWAFMFSALGWQRVSGDSIFLSGPHPLGEIGIWALDLSCRGMFFDIMEHFDLSFTHVKLNLQNRPFAAFSFCYRLYCSAVVLAALFNIVLYVRARRAVLDTVKQEPKP